MDGRTALVLDVKRVTRRLTSRKLQTHIDAIHRRICLKPIFFARSAAGGEEYVNYERMLFEMTRDGLKVDSKRVTLSSKQSAQE